MDKRGTPFSLLARYSTFMKSTQLFNPLIFPEACYEIPTISHGRPRDCSESMDIKKLHQLVDVAYLLLPSAREDFASLHLISLTNVSREF
jgi:hypothetical protein